MIQELLKAFILIFIAEMGDKTQILAMAFATRFPVKKVLAGIFLGAFLNHGLAVLLGSYISTFIPISTVQIVAGFAFVGFSLWTLKPDGDAEEEEKQKFKFGPIATVAIAFFIGELGDKTQLTAITLATDASYPLFILGGTVLGMIVTGGIGIIVGKKLGDKIPEFTIKIAAATVFMFFGVTKLYQNVPKDYLNSQNILIFIVVITAAVFILIRPTLERKRKGQESVFIRQSKELYNYYHKVEKNINRICLGVTNCGECKGSNCIIGHTKALIKIGLDESAVMGVDNIIIKEKINKGYDKELAVESLRMTLILIKQEPNNSEYKNINEIRRNLEVILFGRSIEEINDWNEYKRCLDHMDETIARSVLSGMNN